MNREVAVLVDHGLMRLLVDLPSDRRSALANAWKVTVAGGTGLTVALYRRMLTEGALAEALDGLDEADRMIFRRLALSPRFRSQHDLMRSLPFAEERIVASLSTLEGLGLVWPGGASVREHDGRTWFVPGDLIRALSSARRPTVRTVESAQAHSSSPTLRVLDQPIVPNVPSDLVVDLIDPLGDRTAVRNRNVARTDPAIQDLARRIGVGLGVWEQGTRAVRPGPRNSTWQEASDLERRRAVARLWLVEGGAHWVDGPLRRAAWDTLSDAEPERWYDFNSVARVVASKLGSLEAKGNASRSTRQSDPNRALNRVSVERVLLDLTWLGVLCAATNPVGRLVGIQLTPSGKRAIEEL